MIAHINGLIVLATNRQIYSIIIICSALDHRLEELPRLTKGEEFRLFLLILVYDKI